jgi:hypothetical protein
LSVADDAISQLGVPLASRYFGVISDCRVPAFFVRLRLDCLIDGVAHKSLEDVASHFVRKVFDPVAASSTLRSAEKAIECFAKVAWGAISSGRQFRCDVFSKEKAIEFLDSPDASMEIEELIHKLGLVESINETTGTVRFTNDPLAEYLAPVAWWSTTDDRKDLAWSDLKQAAHELPDKDILEMRGTIIGFYNFWARLSDADKERWKWAIDLAKFNIDVEE